MNKTLILTGWKYTDYAVAAALALRHYGNADLLGMSRRRLPEYLDEVEGYSEIAILGVSLAGDAERLAKALKRLKENKVKVRWISGLDFSEWIGEEVRENLDSFISPSGSVSVAVAECFQLGHSALAVYLDAKHPLGKKYQEFMRAAEYCYRNYQDEQAYPRVIRHLAAEDPESKWTESERRMIEHYRRYGHRELLGKSDAIAVLQERSNVERRRRDPRLIVAGELAVHPKIYRLPHSLEREEGFALRRGRKRETLPVEHHAAAEARLARIYCMVVERVVCVYWMRKGHNLP